MHCWHIKDRLDTVHFISLSHALLADSLDTVHDKPEDKEIETGPSSSFCSRTISVYQMYSPS